MALSFAGAFDALRRHALDPVDDLGLVAEARQVIEREAPGEVLDDLLDRDRGDTVPLPGRHLALSRENARDVPLLGEPRSSKHSGVCPAYRDTVRSARKLAPSGAELYYA